MTDEDPFEQEMERQRKQEEKKRMTAAEKAGMVSGDGIVRSEPTTTSDMTSEATQTHVAAPP